MVKVKAIQQKILGLGGGEYQELMNAYLYKKHKYTNITCLGSEAGTSKTTPGIPDTYVEMENGKYVLIMYGTVKKQSFDKIKTDFEDAFNEDKSFISEERIEKVICCYTSNNISIGQREKLKRIFKGKSVELIGIDDLSYDLANNYQSIANAYLGIAVDSGQFYTIDEFIEKHDKKSTNAPINIDFVERNEKDEVLNSIEENDVVLIVGKAGTGKTKIAIEVCKEYISKNKKFKCLCIKNNGNDIYQDLIDYIDAKQDYLLFIDDINEMKIVKSFFDFVEDKKDCAKIKIVATIRDYLIDNVLGKISNYYEPKIYVLDKMEDEKIKQIVENTFSIRNQKYQEKILEISNGNPRLAVLAAKGIREGKIETLNNVVDIFQKYYCPVIKENDLNEEDIKVLFIISLLGPINIENDNIINIITKFGIEKDVFVDIIKKLNKLELVDYFEGKATKTSDQNFSNYIVYKTLIEDKLISISELIVKLYPQCFLKIIDAINMIDSIFYNVESGEYICSEIKELWSKEPYLSDPRFLIYFYNVDRIKALKIIKNEIDSCKINKINLKELDFNKKKNYQKIDDKRIDILSSFKYGEYEDEAIDLLIEYYKKRPDLIMDFYFAFTANSGIDENSNTNKYAYEIKVIDKFMDAIKQNDEYKFNLSYLLLKILADYLKYDRQIAKRARKKMTINLIRIRFQNNEETYNFRKKVLETLNELYKNDETKEIVDEILVNYDIYPSETEAKCIFEKDIENINKIFDMWKTPNLIECSILEDFEELCEKANIDIPIVIHKYNENLQYIMLKTLSGDRKYIKKWEEAEANRKEKVISLIKDYEVKDYSMLFKSCKECEAFTERLNLYRISNSIIDIFIYVVKNKNDDLIDIFNEYIKNNAPFTIRPEVLIYNILQNNNEEKILKILLTNEYEKKYIFLNAFYSVTNNIKDKYIENLLSLLDDQSKNDNVYLLDFNSLLKYEKIRSGTIEKYCEKLIELFPDNSFVLSKLFENIYALEQKRIDDIINSFENIDILEDVYIAASNYHIDFDGSFGSSLLKKDENFIDKFIDNMDNFSKNSSQTEKIISNMWLSDNYEHYIDRAYAILERKTFYDFEDNKLFYKDKNEIMEKKEEWIKKYIENNSKEMDKMIKIFNVINNSFDSKKKSYILQFLSLNKSIEDFKHIPLFTYFSSWTHSEIPLIEKKINYLENIKTDINGIDFIEHIEYINSIIEGLKREINDIKIREYLEDYI